MWKMQIGYVENGDVVRRLDFYAGGVLSKIDAYRLGLDFAKKRWPGKCPFCWLDGYCIWEKF